MFSSLPSGACAVKVAPALRLGGHVILNCWGVACTSALDTSRAATKKSGFFFSQTLPPSAPAQRVASTARLGWEAISHRTLISPRDRDVLSTLPRCGAGAAPIDTASSFRKNKSPAPHQVAAAASERERARAADVDDALDEEMCTV